jgi:ATP-dependent Clp protease ATP-binding subunit ClpA
MELNGVVENNHRNTELAPNRYNLEAQRAIAHARMEAMSRGSHMVTVADLLAGLTWEEGTRAERIGDLKTNAMYLRWLVGLSSLPCRQVADPAEPTELDHGVRIALAYAWAEADRDGGQSINTDHLLRGLLRFPNVARFALLKIEVKLHSTRAASKLDREEFFAKDAPFLMKYQGRIRRYATQLVPSAVGLACYLYILIQGIAMSHTPLAR